MNSRNGSPRGARRTQGVRWLAALALCLGGVSASGQSRRDLIEEALDQIVESIEIHDAPVREALKSLEEKTGLPFVLDDAVADLLPYGARTRVSIEISGMSVRDSLSHVLQALGLRMDVQGERVKIVPTAWLARLGRRATVEEIALIETLVQQPGSWLAQAGGEALDFRIDPDQRPRERFEQALAQAPGGDALRRLECATAALGWVWWPEGDRVVVCTAREDVSRRLDWPLDLAYQRIPLDEALVDLGKRVGVTMQFQAGALRDIAARDRKVDLVQRGVSLRQTLERVCGATGLSYEVQDSGVLLRCGGAKAQDADKRPEYLRMEVEIRPGVKVDVLVPECQVPPELREELKRRLQEGLGAPRP